MTFDSLFNAQNGILQVQAVDSLTLPQNVVGIPGDVSASSSNSSILSVAPVDGQLGNFKVTANAAGDEDVTVTGTNAAEASISTVFSFHITQQVVGGVAVGFIATLTNIQNN